MRVNTLLIVALVATVGLAGCLSPGEPLEEAGTDPVMDGTDDAGDEDAQPSSDDSEDRDDADEDASEDGSSDQQDAGSGNETQTDDDGDENDETSESGDTFDDEPVAVIGHVDTGINPYHEAFRDDSHLAHVHPSKYIDGYPEDAEALNLTLDAESYDEAVAADEDVWANVTEDQLYWIPGTRIDAAVSFGASGAYCDFVGLSHEYLVAGLADSATDTVSEETPAPNPVNCPEDRPILDGFGHGTMTASRMAGEDLSLCEDCRIASIEGLGASAVAWADDAGWIDVLSNSWVDLTPAPANQHASSTSETVAQAADSMVTVFATGNGAAYLAGGVFTPTYTLSTAPPGVILVGAHDNGNIATWSGSPPHVIADGFQSLAAEKDSLSSTGPLEFACCTSSAAPYAAGAAAQLVYNAREAVGDTSNGVDENGTIAKGPVPVHAGPLSDGEFTLEELRSLVYDTAQMPPQEGPHDGNQHWLAQPSGPPVGENPSGNPYCGLCWTTPVAYDDLPSEVPTYMYTGYGAINPTSLADAVAVMDAEMDQPDREQADTFYELDQEIRELYYPDG